MTHAGEPGRNSSGHTERQSFMLELALFLDFKMVNDDGDIFQCTENQLIDFAERIERAGWIHGAEDIAEYVKEADEKAKGEVNIRVIPVSRIKRAWLRRLVIAVTVPACLAYCFTWIPFAIVWNAAVDTAFALVLKPARFSWTALRTAWEQW